MPHPGDSVPCPTSARCCSCYHGLHGTTSRLREPVPSRRVDRCPYRGVASALSRPVVGCPGPGLIPRVVNELYDSVFGSKSIENQIVKVPMSISIHMSAHMSSHVCLHVSTHVSVHMSPTSQQSWLVRGSSEPSPNPPPLRLRLCACDCACAPVCVCAHTPIPVPMHAPRRCCVFSGGLQGRSSISVSVMEIYNDKSRDLLVNSAADQSVDNEVNPAQQSPTTFF